MKYDAIVFDLDGTLWDATKTSASGWTNALKSLHIDRRISVQEIERVTGKPTEECVKILLPDEYGKYYNLLEIIKDHEKAAIIKEGGKLYDNCVETIRLLKNSYKLFIVSNCEKWYLHAFLDHSGCRNHFTDYDCYGMSNMSKTVMLKDLRKKYDLQNPVFIGDLESDKLAADEAGFTFIYAGYGFGDLQDPVNRINTLSELKKLLE